jgi:hypothetical protein
MYRRGRPVLRRRAPLPLPALTVESKISGREDQIKEFVIGREVFDRKDGYDPRLDPIVRVEARPRRRWRGT